MKKLFALAALAPLALASCDILGGVPKGDVTGSISGTPAKAGTVKVALTGLTSGGIFSDTPDQITLGTLSNDKKLYSISLPNNPNPGLYSVYAFTDINSDGKFNLLTESRTKLNDQVLRYSSDKGWELVKGLNVVKTGKPFSDYNLSW